MPPQYKFVEVAPVTDETLEQCVNEWVARDWVLEGIRFVMSEHSKRPSMAFVSFTREQEREEKRIPHEDGAPNVIVAKHGADVD
jgi:hypothetical protein